MLYTYTYLNAPQIQNKVYVRKIENIIKTKKMRKIKIINKYLEFSFEDMM